MEMRGQAQSHLEQREVLKLEKITTKSQTWSPRSRYCPSWSETVSSWEASQLSRPTAYWIKFNSNVLLVFKTRLMERTGKGWYSVSSWSQEPPTSQQTLLPSLKFDSVVAILSLLLNATLPHFKNAEICVNVNGKSKIMMKFVYWRLNNCTETVYVSLLLRMAWMEKFWKFSLNF